MGVKIMEKSPDEMVNIELLEAYSFYTKLGFRTIEEQNFLAVLRKEILKRMENENENISRQ